MDCPGCPAVLLPENLIPLRSGFMSDEPRTKRTDKVDEPNERLPDEVVSEPLKPADPVKSELEKSGESKLVFLPRMLLRFWRRLARYLLSLIFEFVGLSTWLIFAEALRYLLKIIYGDPQFFDRIPIRFVIDLGELALLITFFYIAIRKLLRDSHDD